MGATRALSAAPNKKPPEKNRGADLPDHAWGCLRREAELLIKLIHNLLVAGS
jgi:hypothetical protein